MPVTKSREKAVEDGENLRYILAQVPYICYPLNFEEKSVSALFDSGNKVNAIYATFVKELSLSIRPINVQAQKIDGNMLDTYSMIVIAFLMMDKAN